MPYLTPSLTARRAKWPLFTARVWGGKENKPPSIHTSKEPLEIPVWFEARRGTKTARGWRLYLHATDPHAQRCRGALLTLLDVPGFLLLRGIIPVLPSAHLQVQDAGVAVLGHHVLQQEKL